MNRSTSRVFLALWVALASASIAQGQTGAPPRFFLTAGGGYQSVGRTLTESGSFSLYDELGSFVGSRPTSSGGFLDAGGGVRIAGALSIGVACTWFTNAASVPYTVTTPHPLLFAQPRSGSLVVKDLSHTEAAAHVQLIWRVWSSRRYQISLEGGPSFFKVEEDSMASVSATETGSPYTAVTLDATFTAASKTGIGGHAGVIAGYALTPHIGLDMFFRYAAATPRLTAADGTSRTVRAGGPQVGAVFAYRF